MRRISFYPRFDDWQIHARQALAEEWLPSTIFWEESTASEPSLDFFQTNSPAASPKTYRIPKKFIETARLVALHSGTDKWDLLYRALWRMAHGETRFLENPIDADALALEHSQKEVTKDAYRMTAFLRFREMSVDGESWFVAWYEPEHDTVEMNAAFFIDRFPNMRWSILTPRKCMHWDGAQVTYSEGVSKSAAPSGDRMEALWISYYSKIFNPARIKVRAMQAQLLKRNWKNLPEASVIDSLIRTAPKRVDHMLARSDFLVTRHSDYSAPPVPKGADWDTLRDAAATCRACPLWKQATCTVFGEGPRTAKVVLVGEQPGEQEDRTGKPFAGPAGKVLDRALTAAGIDRSLLYVTNAVKHYKFEPRGKRRINKTANVREIATCRPWLASELDLIKPELVVALGATASHALFGVPIKVLQQRGLILDTAFGLKALVTVHPASLLRLPNEVDAEIEFAKFVADLRQAKEILK